MEPLHHDPRGWTLYRADYRDTLAEVAKAGGADLIAFSPPYCDARTYGMNVSWDHADYTALGDAVFGALKPGGHALVNVDAPVREWRPGFGTERGFHPWRMMLDWAERVGFRVPDRLCFGRHGQPGIFPYFRNDWEPLLIFQRLGGAGFCDAGAIGEWADPRNQRPKSQGSHRARTGEIVKSDGPSTIPTIRRRGTLWAYGATGNGYQSGAPDIEDQDHPARWPYRLARDIVLCFCPPGGLVVDPFVGAGTTAAAAIGEGRRFIGGDLGQRDRDGMPWATVAHGVLTERNRQVSLFGGAG
jgi:site-specific DNA-methyltransferase (adenine-specific)